MYSIEEFTKILQMHKLVIYGAGCVADMFYKALSYHGMAEQVVCFAVTKLDSTNKNNVCNGYPLITIDQVARNVDTLICIATHAANKDGMIQYLNVLGIDTYLWIYPWIHEMLFGKPIHYGGLVSVRKVICTWPYIGDYGFSVRKLVIDQFFQKNDYGFDLYQKIFSALYNKRTGEDRLNQFKKLIKNWVKNGYNAKYPIKIDKSYRIFDGEHRLILAYYFNQKEILADIYEDSFLYDEFMRPHLVDQGSLKKNGFFDWEIEKLEEERVVINKFSKNI